MTRRLLTTACLAAIVASSAACGSNGSDKAGGAEPGQPLVLTLAAYADPDPDELVAAVDTLSGGSLRIHTTTGWRGDRPDYEQATIEDVRRGDFDLAVVGARVFDLLGVTSFRGLLAPFLVDSLELQQRVLESPLATRMLAGVDAAGVVGVGVLPGDLRRPVGLARPLVRVGDFRGAIVGMRPSLLAARTFRALGATPRPAEFPRDLRALDGADYDVTGLDYSRYDLAARSLAADVVLWPRALVVIANPQRWAALSPRRRALLRRAAQEAVAPAVRRIEGNEESALRAVCARGVLKLVNASAAERAALRAAVEPVYEELRRDPLTREVITRIEATRGTPAPDVLRCPGTPSSGRPTAEGSVLDGTWEWSATRAELLEAGDTPAGAGRNTGRWRLVLANGRFELQSLTFGDVYKGTYTLEGDRLVARVDGTKPTDPPGQYRWTVYRGRLSFAPVEGKPYAPQVVVKPMTRAR